MGADATAEPAARTDDGTTLGPSREILAALGYVFNLLGALALLVLEDDAYVRHHAAQSLVFTGVVVVARLVGGLAAAVVGFVPFVGDLLAALITFGVWALAAGGFLLLAFKAFTGERYTVPGLGGYVDEVERAF